MQAVFREAIAEGSGSEESIQKGFDVGYVDAATISSAIAELQSILT